jgi:GNAT superfamily N-acetyltransferase
MNVVIQFPRSHRVDAIGTLVAAFADDPGVRRLYPTDADYYRGFPGLLRVHGGPGLERGLIDRDAEGVGAALWLPSGTAPDKAALADWLQATVPPARRAAILAGLAQQAALRPLAVHWNLAWLGVRPEARGRGVGAHLLARGLARADAHAMPCYVEATGPRAAAFFARAGFVPLGTVAARGYPPVVAMWRSGSSQPFSA